MPDATDEAFAKLQGGAAVADPTEEAFAKLQGAASDPTEAAFAKLNQPSVRDTFIAQQEARFGKPETVGFSEPVIKPAGERMAQAWHETMDQPLREVGGAAQELGAAAQKFSPLDVGAGARPIPGTSDVRDVAGAGAKYLAKGVNVAFAPVGAAIHDVLGDPASERPETLDQKAGNVVRGTLKTAIESVPQAAMEATHLPGVKQGLEFVGGKDAPESVGTILPFFTGEIIKGGAKVGGKIGEVAKRVRRAPPAPELPPAGRISGAPPEPTSRIVSPQEAARIVQEMRAKEPAPPPAMGEKPSPTPGPAAKQGGPAPEAPAALPTRIVGEVPPEAQPEGGGSRLTEVMPEGAPRPPTQQLVKQIKELYDDGKPPVEIATRLNLAPEVVDRVLFPEEKAPPPREGPTLGAGWDRASAEARSGLADFKRDMERASPFPDAPTLKNPDFISPPERPKHFGSRGEHGSIGEGVPDIVKTEAPKPVKPPQVEEALNAIKQKIRFGPETKPKIGQRISTAAKRFYDVVLRKEGAIGRLERDLTGKISDTGPTRLAQRAQGGAAGRAKEFYNEGAYETFPQVKSVRDSLKEVKSGDLSDVAAYSIAKRIETGYNPRRFEHGFNNTSVGEVVNYFEQTPAHADIVRAANAIHAHYDTLLKNLADAEGWPVERYEAMRKANPFYVRFLRQLGEEGKAPAVSAGGRPFPTAKLKRVTGGDQPLADPIPLVYEDTRTLTAAADQARVRRSVIDLVRQHPERSDIATVMDPAEVAKSFPKFDEIARAMEKPDVTEPGVVRGHYGTEPEVWAEMHDVYQEALRKNVLFDFSGAKPVALKITDPLLARALAENTPGAEALMRMLPTKVAGAITGVQRAGITQLAPRFALRNPIRDFFTYYHYSDTPVVKMPLRLVQGFVESLRGQVHEYAPNLVEQSKWAKLYKRAGVEGFFDVDKNAVHADLDWLQARGLAAKVDYFRKRPLQIVGKPVARLLDIVRDANQTTEGMYRYAEMIETAQRRGITPDKFSQADLTAIAAKAGDVTLNFRLGGEYAKVANRYEAFLNAQIQGLVRYGSEWRNRPGRMAARTAPMVAAKAALWAYIQNDEKLKKEYDRMPAWRRLLWNLPYEDKDGNARFISLPTPAEIMALPNLVEIGLNAFAADDPGAAKDMAKELAKSVTPGSGLAAGPSVVRPLVEVHQGKSEFTGRPINPPGKEAQAREAPETVVTPNTTPIAQKVSSVLSRFGIKWTPPEIDHVIRGYGGSVAKEATSVTEQIEAADQPLIGSFSPRAKESRVVDEFYRLADRFEGQGQAFKSLAQRGDEAGAEKYATGAAKIPQLGKIREAMKALSEQYTASKSEPERIKIAKDLGELATAGSDILKAILGDEK